MDKFVTEYQPYAFLLVFIVEYLLANTKAIKSNSTIDLAINIIKFVFGIKEEDKQ